MVKILKYLAIYPFLLHDCQLMITFAGKSTADMTDEQYLHPLIVSTDLINELGLIVFDDIHQMPIYGEPYITPYFTLSICVKGWLDMEYDSNPVRFQSGDVAIVHANHTLYAHSNSDDYHNILVAISPRFESELRTLTPATHIDFYHYLMHPSFHLTENQQANILRLIWLMKSISLSDIKDRELLLKGMLHITVVLLQNYRTVNGQAIQPLSPRQELVARFHQAIIKHFRESREVRFYANLFCQSPKHFSTVIKEHTGINALQWINNYVTIQAKTLLRSRQQMTIQQVAHHLGFQDQASFSRFFKSQTGVSPSEYRSSV